MTLDELEKICAAATPLRQRMHYSGIALDISDADVEFIAAARMMLPKLLAVAKAALGIRNMERIGSYGHQGIPELLDALAELEQP